MPDDQCSADQPEPRLCSRLLRHGYSMRQPTTYRARCRSLPELASIPGPRPELRLVRCSATPGPITEPPWPTLRPAIDTSIPSADPTSCLLPALRASVATPTTNLPTTPTTSSAPPATAPRDSSRPAARSPYTIEFSNEKTAEVPADNVVVTEQLSPNLDWSTFQLGTIGFGSYVVNVPPGLTSYSTRVDATATLGVYVDIDASLNLSTGLLTVTFTSLDPTTLDTPSNPLVGFLPPDTNPPNGEGYINYTIQPKAGLATGATLDAQASIVFDTNAADRHAADHQHDRRQPADEHRHRAPRDHDHAQLHRLLVRLRRRRPGHRQLQRLCLRRRRRRSRSGSRTPRRPRRPTPARSATPTASTASPPTTSASSSRRRGRPGHDHGDRPPRSDAAVLQFAARPSSPPTSRQARRRSRSTARATSGRSSTVVVSSPGGHGRRGVLADSDIRSRT